ncbi:TRAUB-domain-containing protein, partial [Tricholoma matsutake]
LSLKEQITQLEEAIPIELDPEDTQTRDADENVVSIDIATKEHYLDVGPSTLRKLHDGIWDPKYDGVKTTRKRLLQENSEEELVRSESEGVVEGDEFSETSREEDQSAEEGDADEISSVSDEENKELPLPSQNVSSKNSAQDHMSLDDLTSTLQKTQDEDRKKGRAISRQIALWNALLDARIRMQKSVVTTNRLPAPFELQSSLQSLDYREVIHGMMEEVSTLSSEIFELQEELLTSNESITVPPRKRRKIQTEDTVEDYAACLDEAAQMLSTLEQSSHPYLVQALSKWSSKIQTVAPSVLLPPNRNTFLAKSSQHSKSAVHLIDETLRDQDRILARTRVQRGKMAQIGDPSNAKEEVVEDKEVFDDTDFYRQLLRDVIDARGTSEAEDWMTVQRQKKAKKTVDTRASKGRKIRQVHEKLRNFMVPIPVVGSWHEEQIDELFSSLLGKGFMNSLSHLNDEEQ